MLAADAVWLAGPGDSTRIPRTSVASAAGTATGDAAFAARPSMTVGSDPDDGVSPTSETGVPGPGEGAARSALSTVSGCRILGDDDLTLDASSSDIAAATLATPGAGCRGRVSGAELDIMKEGFADKERFGGVPATSPRGRAAVATETSVVLEPDGNGGAEDVEIAVAATARTGLAVSGR